MRYPTYSELIFINGRVLDDEDIMTGKTKIRDIDLLLAAEQRPQASAFGQDAYPGLTDKAVALLHAIARNHPFKDGNKRTATVSALFLLEINGQRVVWEPEEALTVILDLAEGRREMSHMLAWLETIDTDPAPEADAARDTMRIDHIIAEQDWLLHELAKR
jgi:death-on-curing protein